MNGGTFGPTGIWFYGLRLAYFSHLFYFGFGIIFLGKIVTDENMLLLAFAALIFFIAGQISTDLRTSFLCSRNVVRTYQPGTWLLPP